MAIIKKFVMKLGKMDEMNVGIYNHPVEITVELREHKELKNGELSMVGRVWLPSRRDTALGGQCEWSIDPALLQPEFRERFIEIRGVWDRWHLNDMNAGSPAQEAALRAKFPKDSGSYELHIAYLKEIGIYNDPDLDGYKYGSKWLREELPQEVLDTITKWSEEYAV